MQNADSHAGRVSLIVQADDLNKLAGLLKSNGVRVDGRYAQLGAVKIEAPLSVIQKLASNGNTRYLSLDRRVQSLGHVTTTTGAEAARRVTTASTVASSLGVPTTTTTTTVLDRSGVGVAVPDSRLDTGHKALLGKNDLSRILD